MSVITELERLIGRIDALISALPERGAEYDHDQWKSWRAAEKAAFEVLLADEGGKSRREGGSTIYLRLAGVSSSSTSGRAQAMRNWQWAARRRIAKLRQAEAGAATPIATVNLTGHTYSQAEYDDAYEIGKRDGYSEAVQQIDQLTGGDGEYRYCLGDEGSSRHTPGPAEMIQRIVDRFEVLNLLDEATRTGSDQPDDAPAPAPRAVGSEANHDLSQKHLIRRCVEIADQVVPSYRGKGLCCTGPTAKRWQAAYDGAARALGLDDEEQA